MSCPRRGRGWCLRCRLWWRARGGDAESGDVEGARLALSVCLGHESRAFSMSDELVERAGGGDGGGDGRGVRSGDGV